MQSNIEAGTNNTTGRDVFNFLFSSQLYHFGWSITDPISRIKGTRYGDGEEEVDNLTKLIVDLVANTVKDAHVGDTNLIGKAVGIGCLM